MATKDEILAAATQSHDAALKLLEALLNTPPAKVTIANTVDEIIAGTIGTVSTGLAKETKELPDLSKKLTDIDALLKELEESDRL